MIGLFALVLVTIVAICIIKKCKKEGCCAKQELEKRGKDNKSKPNNIYEKFCIKFVQPPKYYHTILLFFQYVFTLQQNLTTVTIGQTMKILMNLGFLSMTNMMENKLEARMESLVWKVPPIRIRIMRT